MSPNLVNDTDQPEDVTANHMEDMLTVSWLSLFVKVVLLVEKNFNGNGLRGSKKARDGSKFCGSHRG